MCYEFRICVRPRTWTLHEFNLWLHEPLGHRPQRHVQTALAQGACEAEHSLRELLGAAAPMRVCT